MGSSSSKKKKGQKVQPSKVQVKASQKSTPVSAGAAQPGAAGAATSTTTVSPPPPLPPATGAKVVQVAVNGTIDALAEALAARWISPRKLLDLCDEDGSGDMDLHECAASRVNPAAAATAIAVAASTPPRPTAMTHARPCALLSLAV